MKKYLLILAAALSFVACDKAEEIHPWEQPYMGELSIEDPYYNTIFKSFMSGAMEGVSFHFYNENGEEELVFGGVLLHILFLDNQQLVTCTTPRNLGPKLWNWRFDTTTDVPRLYLTPEIYDGPNTFFHEVLDISEDGFTLKDSSVKADGTPRGYYVLYGLKRSSMSRKEFIRTYIEGNEQFPKR